MRRILALGLLWFATTSSAQAGIFNPAEPEKAIKLVKMAKFFDEFREKLNSYRFIGMEPLPLDYPLRREYFLVDKLATESSWPGLSLEQKISVSAVYLRRKKFEEARALLEKVTRDETQDNILVLSHLAHAYHRTGELSRAHDTMRDLLKNHWPELWTDVPEEQRKFLEKVGFHEGIFGWHRKVEGYYARLVRSRLKESFKKQTLKDETPEPIFVDNAGESILFWGDGKNPPNAARLPEDAPEIVQQLLYWLPDDNRLYWLLGEIYVAKGTPDDLRTAYSIFDELLDPERRQYHPELLAERFRRLRDRVDALPPPESSFGDRGKNAQETANKEDESPFKWQPVFVGFGAGFIVAIFAGWQLREIRRRRQPGR